MCIDSRIAAARCYAHIFIYFFLTIVFSDNYLDVVELGGFLHLLFFKL